MQRDPRAFLWDVRAAALAIQAFTAGMNSAAYAANQMAQSAVERKFEIIGGAHSRLAANRGVSQSTHPWLCHRERRHGLECDAKRVATRGHCGASALGRVGRRLNQF
jgi:uncharacterized protein with HEPN domain